MIIAVPVLYRMKSHKKNVKFCVETPWDPCEILHGITTENVVF